MILNDIERAVICGKQEYRTNADFIDAIEAAVIAKLCAEVELLKEVVNLQVENYAELKEQNEAQHGYFNSVMQERDALQAEVKRLEAFAGGYANANLCLQAQLAAARVKALEDAAALAEHENAADWSVSGRQIARQIRALKGGAAETVGGLAKAVKAARGGDAPPAPMRGFA